MADLKILHLSITASLPPLFNFPSQHDCSGEGRINLAAEADGRRAAGKNNVKAFLHTETAEQRDIIDRNYFEHHYHTRRVLQETNTFGPPLSRNRPVWVTGEALKERESEEVIR